MTRAENFVGAKVEHISFHRDTLLFDFANTKINQEGIKNIDHLWHLYENNLELVVCPLISLSRWIIAYPPIITGQRNLIKVHYPYERINKIFNEVVRTHRSEFECLGISVEYFGTHSIRKGANIFVATGCTVSLPMASICLHTNWTLGEVNDR